MILSFEIPALPKTPNSLLRQHWSLVKKEKDKWHMLVALNCIAYKGEPLVTAKLILTRYSASEPDFDGLCGSFKFVIDGLVKAGVLIDDKTSVIGNSEYKWERAKPNKGMIKVEILCA